MNIAISLKNVSFSYNNTASSRVLSNVNLDLYYGKITLIAGASGQGKSTLFHIMNGVVPNSIKGNLTGEVLINGKNISKLNIGQIARNVGSVLQNAELQIIHPIVKEEIAFGLENMSVPSDDMHSIIDNACSDMSLNKEDKTLHLSGGEKQRLITATTLALNSKIIILDEPLANLDKPASILLLQKLKYLKDNGYAIIIIEHRLDMVIDYVNELYHVANESVIKVDNHHEYILSSSVKIQDICPEKERKDVLFDIKDLTYTVRNKTIIDNLNLTIYKGERVVILGDNGQGKSTFTKLLARLIKASGGSISQNLNVKFPKEKGNKQWFKEVAYVYQNPNYQLFMATVEDEILFSAHSVDYAQKIVDMFEIEPLLDRHPHSLSEGQKRKIGVATMLSMKPQVIIFDEPTVGQDYTSLNNLVHIINTIHQEENNTILTITHDIRCAEALADKVIIIEKGKISKVGGKELVKQYFNKL